MRADVRLSGRGVDGRALRGQASLDQVLDASRVRADARVAELLKAPGDGLAVAARGVGAVGDHGGGHVPQKPQDGRSAYAALTELGLRRYRQAAPTYLAGIEENFAQRLSDGELKALAVALQRVLAAPGSE